MERETKGIRDFLNLKNNNLSPFYSLPKDILKEILIYSEVECQMNSLVCKEWNIITKCPKISMIRYLRSTKNCFTKFLTDYVFASELYWKFVIITITRFEISYISNYTNFCGRLIRMGEKNPTYSVIIKKILNSPYYTLEIEIRNKEDIEKECLREKIKKFHSEGKYYFLNELAKTLDNIFQYYDKSIYLHKEPMSPEALQLKKKISEDDNSILLKRCLNVDKLYLSRVKFDEEIEINEKYLKEVISVHI